MMRWMLAIRGRTYQNPSISMEQFKILSVIGRGFYGKVMLALNTTTNELLAIKSIQKKKLQISHKIHTVIIERNILESIDHPFIVKFRYAFQTEKKFYFALEYVAGGELFFHMSQNGKLPLEQVKLYVTEIALTLNYLHRIGIVYRDLKPENILIAADGHIKITDFGLSKIAKESNTFCGTCEYLAPEMILRNQYDFAVDWWALGILTYEMLFGKTPWATPNRAKLYHSILKLPPLFPPEADPDAIELITALLQKNPKNRPGFRQIKEFAFFKDFDFEQVLKKEIQPTFIPKIEDKTKPTNFLSEFTSEPPGDSSATSQSENEIVPGFSYTGDHPLSSLEALDEEIIANNSDLSEEYMNMHSDSGSNDFFNPNLIPNEVNNNDGNLNDDQQVADDSIQNNVLVSKTNDTKVIENTNHLS